MDSAPSRLPCPFEAGLVAVIVIADDGLLNVARITNVAFEFEPGDAWSTVNWSLKNRAPLADLSNRNGHA